MGWKESYRLRNIQEFIRVFVLFGAASNGILTMERRLRSIKFQPFPLTIKKSFKVLIFKLVYQVYLEPFWAFCCLNLS